jgi:GNAT superfamily N-acetyltransferase
VTSPSSTRFRFEQLGNHDRTSFSCGVEELDRYFIHQAGQDAKRKVAASFVMLDSARIAGYYTLSAYGIAFSELPAELSKKLPKYPLLPATLLGRLAVDSQYRGQNLGRMLLMDALYRSWANTVQVASVGVIAEAYNDAARDFYLHHEFVPIPGNQKKVFVSMKALAKVFGP